MARSIGIVSLQDPDGPGHGGTLRSQAFINAFGNSDISKYFPDDSVSRGMSPSLLRRLKRKYFPIPLTQHRRSRSISSALRREGVQLVIVNALSFAPVLKTRTDGLKWLDLMDLWSEMAHLEARQRKGLARITCEAQSRYYRYAELRAAKRADIITAAGVHDARVLAERGVPDVKWVPTPIDDAVFSIAQPPRNRNIGMIANFAYYPNVLALNKLISDWLPTLTESGWTVYLAGRSIRSVEGSLPTVVRVLGEVEDVSEFYSQVDATVAPIERGGGMKVKVLESLCAGRPVLATTHAIEGLPDDVVGGVQVVRGRLTSSDLAALSKMTPPADILENFRSSAIKQRIASIAVVAGWR